MADRSVAPRDESAQTHVTVPLSRNRDFNLFWIGQVLSDLGGRVSGIALPLLVLAITNSPAKAGIVAAVGSLPILVLTLPAGALVDRWNRKRVMIATDLMRCLSVASIAGAIAFDRLAFGHILAVALIEGVGFVFFNVSERATLPHLVPDEQLSDAVARNQTREYGALLAGAPLGGALFAAGRVFPFVFDAISYLVSLLTLLLLRTELPRTSPVAERERLVSDMRQGLTWVWQQTFIRTTSLLAAANDLVLNALYLVVIVIARDRGASPALIGLMFVFLGVGGILGSLAAPFITRRVPESATIVGALWVIAALMPLLVILPGEITPGIVYGAMFFLLPAWNAVVGAWRLRLTPDEMRGRVSSISTLLALGASPIGLLAAGFLLEHASSTAAVSALMAIVTAAAVAATVWRAALTPARTEFGS